MSGTPTEAGELVLWLAERGAWPRLANAIGGPSGWVVFATSPDESVPVAWGSDLLDAMRLAKSQIEKASAGDDEWMRSVATALAAGASILPVPDPCTEDGQAMLARLRTAARIAAEHGQPQIAGAIARRALDAEASNGAGEIAVVRTGADGELVEEVIEAEDLDRPEHVRAAARALVRHGWRVAFYPETGT